MEDTGNGMSYFKKFYDYIANTGGSPTIEEFDDDWEPIGPKLRADMKEAGYIYERDGKVYQDVDPLKDGT